ncbi:MAG: transglutaminase N-terminal domain-containing protein, partial [Clostridium sp.]
MKKLKFIYNMCLEFDHDVREHYFSLKCIPKNSSTQRIYSLEYNIEPVEKINHTTDGFGNTIYIGHCL